MKTDQWNAKLYDDRHSFVSNYGKGIVDLLQVKEGERILDLGCGTGDLAHELQMLGAVVVGVDQSDKMIELAKEKYPLLHFEKRNATDLQFKEEFDAVFSNAVLHWVKEPEAALKSIVSSLKEGGRFVAEFGGQYNILRITTELERQFAQEGLDFNEHNPWYYPSIAEYTSIMEKHGFLVTYAEHVDRPTPLIGEEGLRNWLEMFTGSMFAGIEEGKRAKILKQVEESLKQDLYHDGEWTADYKRIRVIGIKEN